MVPRRMQEALDWTSNLGLLGLGQQSALGAEHERSQLFISFSFLCRVFFLGGHRMAASTPAASYACLNCPRARKAADVDRLPYQASLKAS